MGVPALATAGEPPRGRWHFVFDGEPRLAYSVLFVRSEGGDETRLLVDAAAGRFELVSRQPPDGRETFESIRDVASGETLSRTLAWGPVAGPAKPPECARVAAPDACVVLEGSRGRLAAALSAFSGERGAQLSERARAIASPKLLGSLRALAVVFPLSKDFELYTDDFLAFLDPVAFRDSPVPPRLGERVRGCPFDATFGFPCTERERRGEELRFGPTGAGAPSRSPGPTPAAVPPRPAGGTAPSPPSGGAPGPP